MNTCYCALKIQFLFRKNVSCRNFLENLDHGNVIFSFGLENYQNLTLVDQLLCHMTFILLFNEILFILCSILDIDRFYDYGNGPTLLGS